MSNPNRKQIYISVLVWNKLDSLSKYLKKSKVKTLEMSLNYLTEQINSKHPYINQTNNLLKDINNCFLQISNDIQETKNEVKMLHELIKPQN